MRSALSIVFIALSAIAYGGEGMWLPHLLKALNESDMKAQGCKLSAEDIYSVNKGSLKDAVAHFGGFCTSEVISNQGLLLTNHHCGYGNIIYHSTVNNNHLKNGFWAKSKDEELPNPNLFVRFIEEIVDVTSTLLEGVTPQMTNQQREEQIGNNMTAYRARTKKDKFHDVDIRAFFGGNQYIAFHMVQYNDVRLVGAPPESIGKFGAETDNWAWPRHTGDFSLFRIYAGPNNEPAEYSSDNKPFTPKYFLPISMDGVSEGDFTMLFGYPSRTYQYVPSDAIDQLVTDTEPARIKVRDASLKILDEFMRENESNRLMYAAKYSITANNWKKWKGELQGLKQRGVVDKKKVFEAEFAKRAANNPKYNTLLSALKDQYAKIKNASLVREYFNEIPGRNIELMRLMGTVQSLVFAFEKGGAEEFKRTKPRVKTSLDAFYKDFSPEIDQVVFNKLLDVYAKNVEVKYHPKFFFVSNFTQIGKRTYLASNFSTARKAIPVIDMEPSVAVAVIKNDPMYQLYEDWYNKMQEEVFPTYDYHKRIIDSLQGEYTKAQLVLFPEKKFYPDANSTMRVSYGKVDGFSPKDGFRYDHMTYLGGVVQKHIPGDYEFNLDEKLISLYKNKDFGPYADKTGDVPVCFLGSSHTSSGNSGSPAIDANGNLVGLNFDRVWEGTMSDYNYDPTLCRNIMLDIRYVLFLIDKHAGADRIMKELKLVYPKTGKKK